MFLRTKSRLRTATKTHYLAFLALLQLTTVQVLASVYPTQPIADTVYASGQLAQVKWRDDGRAPRLKNMGFMSIDLYVSSEGSTNNIKNYVASLAKDVAPIARSHTVIIPQTLPTNASLFNLHFKPSSPHSHLYSQSHQRTSLHPHAHKPETIYSADFQIVTLTQTADSDPNTDPFPVLSLLHPQSQSTPTPSSEPTSATIVHADPLWDDTDEDQKNTQAQAPLHNGNRRRERMEKAKLRILFMLWPALVGVSMAV
ncbi:hypothetical protein L208DRAFT_1445536 [Tricholoma matsutake]|nr:hypothetical protein L208DRAFT_1445536 [Tricholoma matsutake 945]